jgi:carbon monoxide dehydrogenase subunit G
VEVDRFDDGSLSQSSSSTPGDSCSISKLGRTAAAPSQVQIEAAVERTLVGWGAEPDAGQKLWWMDWNRMIRDAITS